MAQEKIEDGDTVMLKSGGAVMTVQWTDQYDQVKCSWFDGNTPMSMEYSASSLKKINPADYQ